jgi:hypothetical protein
MLTSLGRKEMGAPPDYFEAFLTKPVKASQLYNAIIGVFSFGEEFRRKGQLEEKSTSEFDELLGKRMPLKILLAEDNVTNQNSPFSSWSDSVTWLMLPAMMALGRPTRFWQAFQLGRALGIMVKVGDEMNGEIFASERFHKPMRKTELDRLKKARRFPKKSWSKPVQTRTPLPSLRSD